MLLALYKKKKESVPITKVWLHVVSQTIHVPDVIQLFFSQEEGKIIFSTARAKVRRFFSHEGKGLLLLLVLLLNCTAGRAGMHKVCPSYSCSNRRSLALVLHVILWAHLFSPVKIHSLLVGYASCTEQSVARSATRVHSYTFILPGLHQTRVISDATAGRCTRTHARTHAHRTSSLDRLRGIFTS